MGDIAVSNSFVFRVFENMGIPTIFFYEKYFKSYSIFTIQQ